MSGFLGIDWAKHYRNSRMESQTHDNIMRTGYLSALARKGISQKLAEKLLPEIGSVEETINRFVSLSRKLDVGGSLIEIYPDTKISLESVMKYSVRSFGIMKDGTDSDLTGIVLTMNNSSELFHEYSVIYTPKVGNPKFQIARYRQRDFDAEVSNPEALYDLPQYDAIPLESKKGLRTALAFITLLSGEVLVEQPTDGQLSLEDAIACLPQQAEISDTSSSPSGLGYPG